MDTRRTKKTELTKVNPNLERRVLFLSTQRKLLDRFKQHMGAQGVDDKVLLLMLWSKHPATIRAVERVHQELQRRGQYLAESSEDEQELGGVLQMYNFIGELLDVLDAHHNRIPFPERIFDNPIIDTQENNGAQPVHIVRGHNVQDPSRQEEYGEYTEQEELPLFLPPDEVPQFDPTGIPGVTVEARGVIPRMQYLQELLNEMGVYETDYIVVEGTNGSSWRRELPYNAIGVFLPKRAKVLFVNEAYGQATYIVHSIDGRDVTGEMRKYGSHTKKELGALGPRVTRVCWTGDPTTWKQVMRQTLEQQPPSRRIVELSEQEYGAYLSMNEISRIVRDMYDIRIAQNTAAKICEYLAFQNTPEFTQAPVAEVPTSRSKQGFVRKYSPECVERCIDVLIRTRRPDGWVQNRAVWNEINKRLKDAGFHTGVDDDTVYAVLEELLSQPGKPQEWAKGQYIGKGMPTDQNLDTNPLGLHVMYSPELADAAVERIMNETAPNDWYTLYALQSQIQRDISARVEWIELGIAVLDIEKTDPSYETGHFRATGTGTHSSGLSVYMNPALFNAVIEHYKKRS